MTSSISSSETIPVAETALQWRRWLVAFFSVPVMGACVISASLIAIDPYDTGKFALFGINGVDDQNTVTAIPSRARDPQFDSAIIGNSTVQRLNPAELSQATGRRFVQLYKIGATPREELTVLDLFMRKHPRPGALVIGADPYWCWHDQAEPAQDLPHWLYDRSFFEYAVRLISWRSIEHAFQRISIGLGWHQRAIVDGFFNYEEIWPPGLFRDVARPLDPVPAATAAERDVFPAVALLDAAIKGIPSDVPVILFVPPTFYTTVPRPGSIEAIEREACNAALARTLVGRPHSRFINYRVDNALTRNPADFADLIHYRGAIAEKISQGIIATLRLGPAAKIEF
jgi:hypothetical protein